MVFDHLSVTERKNPVGVIEAFRPAFAPDEGPVLVIKTMNGRTAVAEPSTRARRRRRPRRHPGVGRDAESGGSDGAGRRRRLHGLAAPQRRAWVCTWPRRCGCGTPVIATGYSGNLDFMNDDQLVAGRLRARQRRARRGGLSVDARSGRRPTCEHAAAAMRRIAGDPALGARLAAAGRRTMEHQPSLADTGRLVRQLLLGGE